MLQNLNSWETALCSTGRIEAVQTIYSRNSIVKLFKGVESSKSCKKKIDYFMLPPRPGREYDCNNIFWPDCALWSNASSLRGPSWLLRCCSARFSVLRSHWNSRLAGSEWGKYSIFTHWWDLKLTDLNISRVTGPGSGHGKGKSSAGWAGSENNCPCDGNYPLVNEQERSKVLYLELEESSSSESSLRT